MTKKIDTIQETFRATTSRTKFKWESFELGEKKGKVYFVHARRQGYNKNAKQCNAINNNGITSMIRYNNNNAENDKYDTIERALREANRLSESDFLKQKRMA